MHVCVRIMCSVMLCDMYDCCCIAKLGYGPICWCLCLRCVRAMASVHVCMLFVQTEVVVAKAARAWFTMPRRVQFCLRMKQINDMLCVYYLWMVNQSLNNVRVSGHYKATCSHVCLLNEVCEIRFKCADQWQVSAAAALHIVDHFNLLILCIDLFMCRTIYCVFLGLTILDAYINWSSEYKSWSTEYWKLCPGDYIKSSPG